MASEPQRLYNQTGFLDTGRPELIRAIVHMECSDTVGKRYASRLIKAKRKDSSPRQTVDKGLSQKAAPKKE